MAAMEMLAIKRIIMTLMFNCCTTKVNPPTGDVFDATQLHT